MSESDSYETEIEANGDRFTITLTKVPDKELLPLMATVPETFITDDTDAPDAFSTEDVTFMLTFVTHVSNLNMELASALTMRNLASLFVDCLRVATGKPPVDHEDARSHPEFEDLDLNEDGTIDLSEMQ